ncbi:hypothetical protein [Roseateles cavernae]|uniref:hypothetical protein n=1 Tax=Roseateles cavernae TaxID=3153578 RepID=UPI0032E4559C
MFRELQKIAPPCRRAWLVAGLCLALAGCGGGSDEGSRYVVDGIRVKATVNKSEAYDIEINGGDCELTVAANNTVKRLLITGLSNKVMVEAGTQIEVIDFTGGGNTVYVPKGFKTRVVNTGSDNKVVER